MNIFADAYREGEQRDPPTGLGVYARKGDPAKAEGTWRVVHGTGKFADMTGEAKWMPIGTFPASGMPNMSNGCNHEWGSYNMK